MITEYPLQPAAPAAPRKGARTKTTILDAAEALFADRGYDGVTLRMIAEAAGVALGLVSYHLQTKGSIFENVVARRAGTLTDLRREAVRDLPANCQLEDVLRAFIRPYRDKMLSGEPGWRAYGKLSAQLAQNARWTPLVVKYFGDFGFETLGRIRQCEPQLSSDAAARGYVFMITVVMGVFSATELLDHFSKGDLSSSDLMGAFEPVVAFVAGGIRALAN